MPWRAPSRQMGVVGAAGGAEKGTRRTADTQTPETPDGHECPGASHAPRAYRFQILPASATPYSGVLSFHAGGVAGPLRATLARASPFPSPLISPLGDTGAAPVTRCVCFSKVGKGSALVKRSAGLSSVCAACGV